MRTTAFAAASLLLITQPAAADGPKPAVKPVDFTRDVKPILADKCFACHGPDEGQRKGDLRLDDREAATENAVRPGNAAGSPLIERVLSKQPSEVMPPPKAKKGTLSPEQVDVLKRWIDQGAKYDTHWAYAKPARPPVPEVANKGWVRNPIDAFIAAGHQKHGLAPSPEADRVTLVRRLTFDLTGLPPTPAEVDAFVSDKSPNAYEKLVDRLLASPHFGERMAVYWLDLVRYADTAGYHSDNHRDVWMYRDWVINAFNANMPYDRFTVEQLAGDLLPNATPEQRVGSGYNRLLQTTEEGGAQAKEYMAKYSADRVRNASSVWLGATMGCAECHSHKYDPYTQKDFYRFAAFFADIQEKAVGRQDQTPIASAGQTTKLKDLDGRIAATKGVLSTQTPALDAALAEWETKAKAELAAARNPWSVVKPAKAVATKSTLAVQPDESVLAGGDNPAKETYTVTLATDLKGITGVRLEALTHPTLANNGLSRANGNFVLTGFEVQAKEPGQDKPRPVKIARAEADFSQQGYPVEHAIDAKADTGWAVDGHVKPADHKALFVFAPPVTGGAGTVLTVVMKHQSQFAGHNVGRFRLALTTAEKPSLDGTGFPDAVAKALAVEPAKRTAAQRDALAAHYRAIAPELAGDRARLAKLEAERKKLAESLPTTLVSMAGSPRPIRVLPRGNWLDDSGEVVTPAVPAFLPQPAGETRLNRLDLAKWVVSPDNPLTARVFVNRLWKVMFGQGIVRSVDDFGTQGTPPTHPELLDWLAVQFQEGGWNVKQTIKLMAMTGTYRQSSVAHKELRDRDPSNAWLARQGRFRLDAEMVRDAALSVSGLLAHKVGGPSAKPYQPAGYWSYLNFPKREWQSDKGDGQYRRGLYTYWCRSFLHPSLAAFDAPTREECTAERPRSSTPLQALALLNDPTYVEASRAFAARAVKEGGKTDAERIDWAYRQAVSRPAKPEEQKILAALLAKHRQEYAADKAAAAKLLGVGDAPVPADVDAAVLAAWTSAARVILNLHEAITRE